VPNSNTNKNNPWGNWWGNNDWFKGWGSWGKNKDSNPWGSNTSFASPFGWGNWMKAWKKDSTPSNDATNNKWWVKNQW